MLAIKTIASRTVLGRGSKTPVFLRTGAKTAFRRNAGRLGRMILSVIKSMIRSVIDDE